MALSGGAAPLDLDELFDRPTVSLAETTDLAGDVTTLEHPPYVDSGQRHSDTVSNLFVNLMIWVCPCLS